MATLVSPVVVTTGEQTVRSAAVTPEGDQIRWVELPGQEPPRVYVHGLGATSPAYFTGAAVHPLLAGHRSLLVDLLGHGISDRPTTFDYTLESHADALAEALAAAGVSGAAVVAHSMGGSVAIVLAARHPRLVSRLVLIDANLDPIPRTPGSPAAAASPPTPRRSSWRAAAGRRSATGSAPTGGPRCVWPAARPCTAARSI
ncbi:alpha/beta hydrolase [Streptomyces massasporeus]|uniref:alpha/beta fold hydrolase n=1 Tax=Streptomyces massasporeus TaxID=67324 RepID=UPI0033CD7257